MHLLGITWSQQKVIFLAIAGIAIFISCNSENKSSEPAVPHAVQPKTEKKQPGAKERSGKKKSSKIAATNSVSHTDWFYIHKKGGAPLQITPDSGVIKRIHLNRGVLALDTTASITASNGEKWLQVVSEQDTGYIQRTLLKKAVVSSDTSFFLASPVYEIGGKINAGFVNISEGINWQLVSAKLLLPEFLNKDTLTLSKNNRKTVLSSSGWNEKDSLFIFDLYEDKVTSFSLSELPLRLALNIYAPLENLNPLSDYEFGFHLGKKYQGESDNLVFIGNNNPFQTGTTVPMIWDTVPNQKFPIQTQKIAFSNSIICTYSLLYGPFKYFLQQIRPEGSRPYDIRRSHLVIQVTSTQNLVFDQVFYQSESIQIPLAITKLAEGSNYSFTGFAIKGKPPIIFGLTGNSFGCPSVTFADYNTPAMMILCDNRH